MSALLTTRPAGDLHERDGVRRPRWEPEAGPTLDDVVSRTWEVLRAGVPAACVVCGADLTPRHAGGAGVVGARCDSCGTALG
jgi:hypothetical protein